MTWNILLSARTILALLSSRALAKSRAGDLQGRERRHLVSIKHGVCGGIEYHADVCLDSLTQRTGFPCTFALLPGSQGKASIIGTAREGIGREVGGRGAAGPRGNDCVRVESKRVDLTAFVDGVS